MRLTHLSIRDFRNLVDVELQPHRHFNVLAGPNGAGKTNVLEAIYVLGNVRSFREGRNRDLVRSDADSTTVTAVVEKFGHSLSVALAIDQGRKRFSINQQVVPSFADYLGTLVLVVFSPSDLNLLRGAASERRRFVDRVVCGAQPAHLADLQDYETALRSRNQLLKEPRLDPALLAVYTDQWLPPAARITARRLAAIDALRDDVQSVFARIFSPDLRVDLDYDGRWWDGAASLPPDAQLIEPRLRAALERCHDDERRAGHTTVGPHRDDLRVALDGMPVREYASQGQTRSIVLALKVTEIRYLERMNGDGPVLLLDDVSSELDERRNAQLFELIGDIASQTFITTTDRRYIRIDDDLQVFNVAAGRITPVE